MLNELAIITNYLLTNIHCLPKLIFFHRSCLNGKIKTGTLAKDDGVWFKCNNTSNVPAIHLTEH